MIEQINSIPTDYKYEILVYSQNEIVGANVRHLRETEQAGPIKAFNEMHKVAHGDISVCLIDDHAPDDPSNFFSFVEFLNSDMFSNRKFKITSFYTGHIPQRVPILGDTWCGGIAETRNNREHTTMRFPIVKRETVKKYLNGYIFHPGFIYHAADLWLGFYIGEETERGIECQSTIKQYVHLRNSRFEQTDCLFYHTLKNKYLDGYKEYV